MPFPTTTSGPGARTSALEASRSLGRGGAGIRDRAAGDVRFGSVKRVASAAGEGSVALGSVHQYLADVAAQPDRQTGFASAQH